MSQITKAPAQVKPRTSDEFYGRAITATLALAAAIIVVAYMLMRPATSVPSGNAGANDLTDGFLPGAIAANGATLTRNAQALTDGWEARLVGPAAISRGAIRDGWEAGLVGPTAPTRHEVTDGWESSLFE